MKTDNISRLILSFVLFNNHQHFIGQRHVDRGHYMLLLFLFAEHIRVTFSNDMYTTECVTVQKIALNV